MIARFIGAHHHSRVDLVIGAHHHSRVDLVIGAHHHSRVELSNQLKEEEQSSSFSFFRIEVYMINHPNTNPYFYYVDVKYINYLKDYETNKRGFTCVPNVHYWNTNKFIFGAVLNVNDILYFAPISSYSKNQMNLILLKDKNGQTLGSIRFNYMIPVPDTCLNKLDINALPTEQNRVHTSKELAFCRRNREKIYKLASKTYFRVTKGNDEVLKNNSCDFELLEQAYKEYCIKLKNK